MRFPQIGITTQRLLLACACASLVGCGASARELHNAKTSGYEADFALVYSEALEAVRKQYPQLAENASAGVIKTAWHPVRLASSGDESVNPRQSQNQATAFGTTTNRRKHYFVRFQIYVVGGKPWRIRVVGQASEWDMGGVPTPLTGAAVPPWLQGRIDSLRVEIHRRLERFAVKLKTTARESVASAPIEAEVDEAQFGGLPPAAAAAIAEVLRASKSRDFGRLRGTMHAEFTWSLGASPDADGALAMWQANSSTLDTLTAVIEAGCRADEDGARVTCPPAYTEQPGYHGFRAGFAKGPDGAWKMIFFVEGD